MVKKTDLEMAKIIATEVAKEGGKTYFVGGYVRDLLLGKENKDIDIEIHNIQPIKLREILNTLGEITEMGASFGILGLHGYDIDIAQPRSEKATGRGHKDFEVFVDPFIGEESAAKRRDFTINGLMQDVLTGEILDFFGGQEDLANGVIRHINDETFVEDSLRVLRACQFAARFGFKVAPETIALSQTMDLTTLPRERVWGELSKALLKAEKPSIFFEMLNEMNQLGFWFPEIEQLKEIEQNPMYHPEGNVFNHTMMVLDVASKLKKETSNAESFMLVALCHDFGKIVATQEINGVVRALEHETLGLPLIEKFLDRVVNETKVKKYVCNLTELHMKPNQMSANKSKIKTTNKIFDECLNPNDLLLLAEADHFGRFNPSDYSETKIFLKERLDNFNNLSKIREVQGRDLIVAGIKPGKHFTEALELAHKLHLAEVSFENALPQVVSLAKKLERKNRN